MWLNKIYRLLKIATFGVSRVLNSAGVGIVVVMMFLVTTDVVLRYVFNRPIKSVYEIVGIMLAVVVCFGMAYSALQKGLVAVEVLVERFSPRVQALTSAFHSLLGLGLFSLICWKGAEQAVIYWTAGATTYVSGLPLAPFVLILVLGSGLLSLVLLLLFFESVSRVVQK